MRIKLHFIALKVISLLFVNWLLIPSGNAVDMQGVKATVTDSKHQYEATELSDAIKQWKKQLSLQPNFEAWQKADYTIHPLGPGTHGWIVIVKASQEVVGYMIVHAKEQGGFALTEYGSGDFELLEENLHQLSYYGPFHGIVINQDESGRTLYTDPFLQESIPLSKYLLSKQRELMEGNEKGLSSSRLPALITNTDSLDHFSPYAVMPWLTGSSLNYAFEDDTSVETLIELGSQLRYTTESWHHTIFSVYAVTGYHEWNEFDLFLAIQGDDEQLTRYIYYDTLMAQGNFYDETIYEFDSTDATS